MNSIEGPSDDQIDQIRREPHDFREYHDSVRCAFQFLSAQERIQSVSKVSLDKHVVEAWQGLYLARPWMDVAAVLAGLKGGNTHYNIRHPLIFPSWDRLKDIPHAETQLNYRDCHGRMIGRYFKTAEGFEIPKLNKYYLTEMMTQSVKADAQNLLASGS